MCDVVNSGLELNAGGSSPDIANQMVSIPHFISPSYGMVPEKHPKISFFNENKQMLPSF